MARGDCVVTVKQVLPGNGWRSVYAMDPPFVGGPVVRAWDILGWALVTHEDCCDDTALMGTQRCRQDVVPLGVSDMGVGSIEDDDNYLGCIAPGEDIPEWMIDAARQYLDGKGER